MATLAGSFHEGNTPLFDGPADFCSEDFIAIPPGPPSMERRPPGQVPNDLFPQGGTLFN